MTTPLLIHREPMDADSANTVRRLYAAGPAYRVETTKTWWGRSGDPIDHLTTDAFFATLSEAIRFLKKG